MRTKHRHTHIYSLTHTKHMAWIYLRLRIRYTCDLEYERVYDFVNDWSGKNRYSFFHEIWLSPQILNKFGQYFNTRKTIDERLSPYCLIRDDDEWEWDVHINSITWLFGFALGVMAMFFFCFGTVDCITVFSSVGEFYVYLWMHARVKAICAHNVFACA